MSEHSGLSSTFSIHPQEMAGFVSGLGRFGALEDGSITRDVYDDAWVAARNWLQEQMEEAGLDVRMDAVGNLFGRIEGSEGGTILTGSHLDSVPRGGRFDGALGILAGVAALRAINQRGERPRKSIEVVALCEEEGCRFYGDFLGSRAIWGAIEDEELDDLRDAAGMTLRNAMDRAGGRSRDLTEAKRNDIDFFIELHIEQGPVLERAGKKIGLVSAITGLCVQTIQVTGIPDHAGTTPLQYRRDALVGAAEMVLGARQIAMEAGEPAVATIGQLTTDHGAVNVIPESVSFCLDARHPDPGQLNALMSQINQAWFEIGEKHGLQVEIKTMQESDGAQLDRDLTKIVGAAARLNGFEGVKLSSGAGHDSQIMARHVPTAMLFVPSVAGRSHSKHEYTSFEDCAAGSAVLASALYALAY